MEKEKAIEVFNKWMDCKDAYQADPSCDGNCLSCEYYASAEEEKEAMLLAISALEKDRWIPVTERLPEDFEGVLAWIERNKWGDGDTPTKTQECAIGWQIDGSWNFDGYSGKGTRCIAWRPLPAPYQEDEA